MKSGVQNLLDTAIESAAFGYSVARSAGFSLEFNLMSAISRGAYAFPVDPKTLPEIRQESLKLLKQDSQNIREGIYPPTVLFPESPLKHLLRLPRVLIDGLKASSRKKAGRTTIFRQDIKSEVLDELPRYYRRNFHFQTDGYLSVQSAELWDHQVEMLFQGTADAMRRLLLPHAVSWARERFGGTTTGKGLHFLEIGASAGRSTRFTKLAFPKARITVVDLSDAYLSVAREKLADLSKIDFVQADGGNLPFKDEQFDAAYSIFLYHELPLDARRAVVRESRRVLKTDGFFGLVDSLQSGDNSTLEPLLREFPSQFHEPYFRSYLDNPMERLLEEAGFRELTRGTGFVSKYCVGRK